MGKTERKHLKRLTGIVVPFFILILVITAVGASFAWFSDRSTVEIASIDFSVGEGFTLDFEVSGNQNDISNTVYNGQTAISPLGAFITDSTVNDYVYTYRARVLINTGGQAINLNTFFEEVEVAFYDENDIPDTAMPYIKYPSEGHTDLNDIRYGFTWYLYKESASNVLYTPYGVGSAEGANSPSSAWNSATPVQQNIPSFTANGEAYVFVIVFCPETLFWYKDSDFDADGAGAGLANSAKSFKDIYATEAYASFDEGSQGAYARSYTGNEFQGATFRFKVSFNRAI